MKNNVISKETTLVLKAFAILGVIFAHVGYEIFADESLLYPLAIFGGISGDLFFFLSGFGLACSYDKWMGKTKEFYIYRIRRIWLPIFFILIALFTADALIHSRYYSLSYILKSFLIIFPTHDLNLDVNSPLWFMTPILIYYLFFPLLYKRSKPVLSALGFVALGFFVSRVLENIIVSELFRLHYLAFPLGILAFHYIPAITSSKYFPEQKIAALPLIFLIIYFGVNSGGHVIIHYVFVCHCNYHTQRQMEIFFNVRNLFIPDIFISLAFDVQVRSL
jgi:hypothetical protein